MNYWGAVKDNHENHRFEMELDGQVVFADYDRSGNIVAITHVETPITLRGQGAASALMRGIMGIAQRENLKIRPICPYAFDWIRQNTEYQGNVVE